ncbi:MAG: SAM-dependent methyltransferase, partial [Aestuariivirgaceae bacterium]
FALPVVDADRVTVTYPGALALMRELKKMGLSNPLSQRSRKPVARQTLAMACAEYEANFADARGRVPATFEIIYLTGWAPHESQQQPLKPGSAKARLADALSTSEHRLKKE